MTLIKSISGIRGTIGGDIGNNLTPFEIISFASAYASFIKSTHPKPTIVIGRDGRSTGKTVKDLVISTLVMCGLDVCDLDYSTTPTVEMSVIQRGAQGGIIISASHNPMNWNALKLLNDKGEFISAADGQLLLDSIEDENYEYVSYLDQGKVFVYDNAIEDHIAAILNLDILDIDLIKSKKYHVIIDPVNSTGTLSIPPLLEKLGCTYEIINGDITGRFNHAAEPKPENLEELCDNIKNGNADLGVAVDPDVDRLAFVDENGRFIGEEYTIVLSADFVLSKKKGSTVSNLSSSRALKDLSKKHECDYSASAVGEVNVVQMMKDTKSVIGGEGNGGVIYPELHYGRDGLVGIAFTLNLMAERGKSLSILRNEYSDYKIVKNKIDLTPEIDVDNLIKRIEQDYNNENINTIDGLKIDFEEGWVHLRKSNTEPIIRVYAEAQSDELADELAKTIIEKAMSLL